MDIEKQKQRLKKAEGLPSDVLEQPKNLFAYLDLFAEVEEAEGTKINEVLICLDFLKGLEWSNKGRRLPKALEDYCYIAISKAEVNRDFRILMRKLQAAIQYIEFKKSAEKQ